MVPLNLTYLHCLQHSLFEHLFNLYYAIETMVSSGYPISLYLTNDLPILWNIHGHVSVRYVKLDTSLYNCRHVRTYILRTANKKLKDARSVALYPYNRSQIMQYLKYMYTK